MASAAAIATTPITITKVLVGIILEIVLRPVKIPIKTSNKNVVANWTATTALMMAVAIVVGYPQCRRYWRFTKAGPTPAGIDTEVKEEATCETIIGKGFLLSLSINVPKVMAQPIQVKQPNAKAKAAIQGLAVLTA